MHRFVDLWRQRRRCRLGGRSFGGRRRGGLRRCGRRWLGWCGPVRTGRWRRRGRLRGSCWLRGLWRRGLWLWRLRLRSLRLRRLWRWSGCWGHSRMRRCRRRGLHRGHRRLHSRRDRGGWSYRFPAWDDARRRCVGRLCRMRANWLALGGRGSRHVLSRDGTRRRKTSHRSENGNEDTGTQRHDVRSVYRNCLTAHRFPRARGASRSETRMMNVTGPFGEARARSSSADGARHCSPTACPSARGGRE